MLSVSSHQLMVSLLLCLLDWCMAVPLSLLLEPITMPFLEDRTSHKAPLLDYIYRVGSLSDSWGCLKVKVAVKHTYLFLIS